MRITKDKYEENHERIVAIASEMFRERGFDGVGVAELMERAGLTHGGFYNHFRSKEDLIAEAIAKGFGETVERYAGHDALSVIALYISRQHRDARGQGCPAAALSCEAARQNDETRSAFAEGVEHLVRTFEDEIAGSYPPRTSSRALTLSLFAQAVGAIVLSRACPDESPLANEFLDACLSNCGEIMRNASER
ncbi:TetR/AcrR family transcriptional regulator [Mesorhizobium sp. DCY119]|uniref:TetR/AcrR family transcriptional regulator n=1 Tax=Mesorhizobium sp. DCY119 TaxID=2108445 RepID=UPI000E72EAEF|nr:TetR/AcrR family transcriptional regulator [Mesorhizobium sp. DCY119]RJG39906.1 TetR/AcrR family transcriptional regulator [Mesorhizobium sp. DCY119]